MKTIAFDFDGVLHKYRKGWHNGTCYDELDTDMYKLMTDLLDRGYSVIILTTRKPKQVINFIKDKCDPPEDFDEFWVKMVKDSMHPDPPITTNYEIKKIPFWKKFWNKKKVVGVTNRKLPYHVLIDDRSMRFDPNNMPTFEDIMNFEPIKYK